MVMSKIITCAPGESLFKKVSDQFWADIRSRQAFYRICSLMRLMGVEAIIQENLDCAIDSRFHREAKAIKTRIGKTAEVTFNRLSFFKKTPTLSKKGEISGVNQDDYLGFVVIGEINFNETVKRNYIFESVIREFCDSAAKPMGPWSAYLHVKRKFRCRVLRDKFVIEGTYFCQQNAVTNVCAHACTAILLNNCDAVESLVTCEDINALLGIDHKNRMQEVPEGFGDNEKATHEGLYPKEIERVFREHKFTPYRVDLAVRRRLYREFIYGFIESGFPALLTFNSLAGDGRAVGHVVAVVGHSLNRQSWFPAAHVCYARQLRKDKPYLPSLNWVDDFMVHDDNFGMQLFLPAHSFRPEEYPDPGVEFMPTHAIGILPSAAGVKLSSSLAEAIAWDALNALFESEEAKTELVANYYVEHLRPHITGADGHPATAVLRTLLLKKEAYIDQLKESKDNKSGCLHEDDINQVRSLLRGHDYLWVVEVTEPELYVGNVSRVLEVVINPKLNPHNLQSNGRWSLSEAVLVIRLPHLLLTVESREGEKEGFSKEPYQGIEGHLPLFHQANSGKILNMD